jgi:hypothetical protein
MHAFGGWQLAQNHREGMVIAAAEPASPVGSFGVPFPGPCLDLRKLPLSFFSCPSLGLIPTLTT